MIRSIMTSLILCILSTFALSQQYFSTIIPTPKSANIYHSQLYDNDKLLISYLSQIDSVVGSTLISLDLNTNQSQFFQFPNYRFAARAPVSKNGRWFCYSDDILRRPAASFLELDNNFEVVNEVEYPVWEENMGVLKTFLFGDYLYNFSLINRDQFPKSLYRMNITDLTGEIVSNKTMSYDIGIKATAFQDADTDYNGDIIMGLGIINKDRPGTHSNITKMDASGTILFEYQDTTAACGWLGANQEVITFPSGEIVHQTALDKSVDLEYFYNDWYIYPIRYTWLSSEGEFIKDTIFHTHRDEEEGMYGIVEGNGDYFFAYGTVYSFPNDSWGLVQKISLDGELLWSKKYKHPQNIEVDDRYDIRILIEQDNGDLITTGVYQRIGEFAIPWVMRLNAHGCPHNGECEEIVITNTNDEADTKSAQSDEVIIWPNPTRSRFYIDAPYHIKSIRLISMTGEIIKDSITDHRSIDLSGLADGAYIIELTNDEGKVDRHMVVKAM